MINFYKFYNKTGLDKDEYRPLLAQLENCTNAYDTSLTPIEHIIKQSPIYSYWYARWSKQERWPEGEPAIMTSAFYAYRYAIDIINGRWPEAEPYIMEDQLVALNYATYFNRLSKFNKRD
jgi:hypothetical protein